MRTIHKFIAFILAFMLTFSSTVIPLKTSMVYALDSNGEEVTEYESIMTSEIADDPDEDTSNETLPVEDTDINEPETTTPEDVSSPLDEMDQIPIDNPLLAEKEEEIVEQTLYARLYEDSSYESISLENTSIQITGLMPAHATVKAYKTNDEIEGKDTIFAFAVEIFDTDDNPWQSEMTAKYEISISHRDLVDKENVYLYERPATTTRYFERTDFDRYTDSVEFEAGLSEYIIATDLPRESEEEILSDSIDEENITGTPENNLRISPTDIITNLIETPIKDETDTDPSEVDTTETNGLDWRADLLNATDEKVNAGIKDSKEESDVEAAHGENITDEANGLEEAENLSTEDTGPSPTEVDAAKDIDPTDESKDVEDLEDQSVKEGENKLSYQQVLADIYTDSSYTMRSDDPTRIKLSGNLPGYTKIKAYPVDIEIENQKVLAAYDIKIFDKDNKEYGVSAANDIRVEITNQKIREADKVEIYHKENEFAPEEKIEIQDKTNDTVTFRAESFSIYAVTDPEARAITFVFLNRNENNQREVWDTQTVRNGEYLIQPELPIFSYKGKFEGWHYYDIETDTFGKKFDFDSPVTVTDSSPKTIYLKGKYPDVAYINFIDRKEVENSDGTISYVDEVLSTKEIPLGDKVTTDDVPVIPGESGTVFSHWALEPEASQAFDFDTPITKDYIRSVQGADNFVRLDLYAVFKKALTVTFDSQGGTHVNKQVVYSENTLSLSDLTKPVRPGYNFKYWSTSPNGKQFNANTPITKDMTLYAVWTPRVVKYTINHFMENADDSGYSLYRSDIKTANAGTYTNADSSAYKLSNTIMNNEKIHFVRADERKIIRGDDSTEINLYYDRDTFTFRIFESYVFYENDVVKVELKWGADTKPYFEEALRKLPSGYTFKENGIVGQTVTSPPRMPKNNYQLLAWREGSNEWNVRIIDVETNQLIRLDAKTSQLSSSFQGYTGGESIPGYTYKYVERPGNNFARPSTRHADGKTSEQNEVWVFYQRNRHTLTFSTNGNGPDIIRSNVLYGSSLAQYAPENYIRGQTKNSQGQIFAGWFENSNGAGNPVDLKTMTMPDNNLKLYAKWEEPVYTVRAYRQRNNPEAGVIELKVKRGDTVDKSKLSADKPPVAEQTKGSELRWYAFINGTLTEYNFSDPVYSDLFLYPVWLAPVGDEFRPLSQIYRVKYKAPQEDGKDYIYTDPNDYVNNAEAIVIPPYINNDYRFPPDKDNPTGAKLKVPKDKVFEGWVIDENSEFTSVTDSNMLNKIYRPGDIVNVIGNIMFKPVFNKYRVTTLTLKEIAPGGSTLEDIVYETRNKENNLASDVNDNRDNEDLRNNDIITLPQPKATNTSGYTFLGWSTSLDTTVGKIFKPGQDVMITDENMPNILYGIWKANRTITIHENQPSGAQNTYKEENVADGNFTLPTPEGIDGYSFKGWSTSPDDNVIYKPGQTINVSEDNPLPTDIYGVWEEERLKLTATFDLQSVKKDKLEYTITITKPVANEDNNSLLAKIFNTSYAAEMIDSGTTTVELGNGESVTFPNIEPGSTISITQETLPGVVTSYSINGSNPVEGNTATVKAANENINVVFYNKDLPPSVRLHSNYGTINYDDLRDSDGNPINPATDEKTEIIPLPNNNWLRYDNAFTLAYLDATSPYGFYPKGWSESPNGEVKYKLYGRPSPTFSTMGDKDLYTIWTEPVEYIVELQVEGGEDISLPVSFDYEVRFQNFEESISGTKKFKVTTNSSYVETFPTLTDFSDLKFETPEYYTAEVIEEDQFDDYAYTRIKRIIKLTPTAPPVPTGLIDNFTPMAIMLALAIMAFAYRLYKRNKLAGGIDE